MFARFFVDRPIAATVLSVVIVILGLVALTRLPVAQYPEVTPPTIQVAATYPGANAKTVADTVAMPIEQQVNGVEGMIYMASRSTNDGQMLLDVTFKLGTDLDTAQVLVQNRVAIAQAGLARRGQADRRDHDEEVAQHLAVRQPHFREAGRRQLLLRSALPEQPGRPEGQGSPGARGRRGRRELPGPPRLQHAHLARPAAAGLLANDRRRRDRGHPGAERPGGGRAARAAARAGQVRRALPAGHPDPGTAQQRVAVRGHHRQDGRQRRGRPPAGRCPQERPRRSRPHRREGRRAGGEEATTSTATSTTSPR